MSVKQEKLKKEQNEAMIFKVSLEMNGDYCERCTGEIREALEPLEASEHESRDEYLFSPNAIFMEMKEICRRQEKCADCALSGICARTINEIKMEDVHRAMNAVKKRKEQKQAENKSI